jgi:hypothetical protein
MTDGMDSMLARPFSSFRPVALLSVATLVAACATLALAAPAHAQFAFGSFATDGDARAGWVNEPNSPPGSADQQSISLFVNGTSANDFSDAARVIFTGVTAPPATPPSFDFKVFTIGGSGGSVRLVVRFSDGGRGELRPLSLDANLWTHIDGAVPDWENRGGSCGDRFGALSYAEVLACHDGAAVTSVELINDSGWLHLGGFQVLVDNISYGGVTVSVPPPPVLGETVGLARVSGQVVVRYPGRGRRGRIVRLQGSAPLPVESVIDSREGRVRLVTSRGRGKGRQRSLFRSGIFRVKQAKKLGGLTDIVLRGSLFGCTAKTSAEAQASLGEAQASLLRRRRRLWGSGSGSFRTRGLYSSGSVRGTRWLTQDTCDGTLTVVVEGVVLVRDFTTGETVTVRAGQRYFANAP